MIINHKCKNADLVIKKNIEVIILRNPNIELTKTIQNLGYYQISFLYKKISQINLILI